MSNIGLIGGRNIGPIFPSHVDDPSIIVTQKHNLNNKNSSLTQNINNNRNSNKNNKNRKRNNKKNRNTVTRKNNNNINNNRNINGKRRNLRKIQLKGSKVINLNQINKSQINSLLTKYHNRSHNNIPKHKYNNNTKKRMQNTYRFMKKKMFTRKNPKMGFGKNFTLKNMHNVSSTDFIVESSKKFKELEEDFIKLYLMFEDKKYNMPRNIQNSLTLNNNNNKQHNFKVKHITRFSFQNSIEAKSTFKIISALVEKRQKPTISNKNLKLDLDIYELKNYVALLKQEKSDSYGEINAIYESLKHVSLQMYKLLQKMVKYYDELESSGKITSSNFRYKNATHIIEDYKSL